MVIANLAAIQTIKKLKIQVIPNQCAHWCGNPILKGESHRHRGLPRGFAPQ